MSAAVAAVILAHDQPERVRHLIGALDGIEIALHCDARTPDADLATMVDGTHGVHLVRRFRTARASWALVEAELAGLRAVLDNTAAEHIIVMSGSCYPLFGTDYLVEEITGWGRRSRLNVLPIPNEHWNHPRESDGGRWRFDRRFLSVGNRPILAAERPIPIPLLRRRLPKSMLLQASSQWKIYSRSHTEILLRLLDDRPDLVRFWRATYAPEESCVASILTSPVLVGDVADEIADDLPWYIDWRGSNELGGHPRWLDVDDLPQIEQARHGARDESEMPPRDRTPKLFARKIGKGGEELIERIDALRGN